MDLSTTYLGLELAHPLVAGASPLSDDMDSVRKLEDAGTAAIVMRSLFEEQIEGEYQGSFKHMEAHGDSFAEALSYFPRQDDFALYPGEYLEHLRRIKEAVDIPVIGSLNGKSDGGWLHYARLIEEAGADALELNIYYLATDSFEDADRIEQRALSMLRIVKESVKIPVSVKLSPFYTALANFASELSAAGADGLVLFNRFYQADIDIEELELSRSLHLSTPAELLLRLRWLAILSGRIESSLAASGGVHSAVDALKAMMAGAHSVQMVSVLLKNGPDYLRTIKRDLEIWLEEHEYDSVRQLQGSMNLLRSPDPEAYERANYMHILQTWRV